MRTDIAACLDKNFDAVNMAIPYGCMQDSIATDAGPGIHINPMMDQNLKDVYMTIVGSSNDDVAMTVL